MSAYYCPNALKYALKFLYFPETAGITNSYSTKFTNFLIFLLKFLCTQQMAYYIQVLTFLSGRRCGNPRQLGELDVGLR